MATGREFAADVTKWIAITRISGRQVIRKVAFDAFRGILLRSPTKTGRFRASNRIGVNEVDTSVEPPRPKGTVFEGNAGSITGEEFQKASVSLSKLKWGDTIHITNNLIYARPLEGGSSAQNGNAVDGIYGATFAELQANLEASIRAAVAVGGV